MDGAPKVPVLPAPFPRLQTALVVLWCSGMWAYAFFQNTFIYELAFVISIPVFAYWGAGLALLFGCVTAGTTSAMRWPIALLLGSTVVWWAGARFPVNRVGTTVLMRRMVQQRLAQHEPALERWSAGGGELGPWNPDDGPDRRACFPLTGGVLDNVHGLVWDPSGAIAAVEERPVHFGGTVWRALPLGGHWYYCEFTLNRFVGSG